MRGRSAPRHLARRRPLVTAAAAAFAALSALAWGLAAERPATAQAPAAVRIELDRQFIAAGETFDAFLWVEGAVDLAGFDAVITYDEGFLSLQSAEVTTSFLASGGRTVVPLGPTLLPGRVELGAVTLPGTGRAGANGDGDVALLTFRALAAGQTVLSPGKVHLVNTAGDMLELDGQPATVSIAGAGVPSPTPAPTATSQVPPAPAVYLPWVGRRG